MHASWAEEQLRQGERPSHFTFRRWQASQARLTEVEVVVVGAVVEGVGGGGGAEEDDEDDEDEGVADDMFRGVLIVSRFVMVERGRRTGRGNVVSSPMGSRAGEDCVGLFCVGREGVDEVVAVGEVVGGVMGFDERGKKRGR